MVVILVNFTCEWPNSQLDPPLVASLRRLVVNHSVASYVIWHGRKSVASHSWNVLSHANFCWIRQVTRGGRVQVVGRPPIGRKASQVSRRSVASVSRWSDRGCDSGARVYADIIAHASRVDRKTTIKNAVPGYATRDGHMTWSRDGHMTKVPDCSKLKNKNMIKKNR